MPISFKNVNYNLNKTSPSGEDWFVVGGSTIGKSHISSNKPCQDNHFCANIKEGWGIAISCDGAGSAENSHLGSGYVSKKAFEIFKHIVKKHARENNLPTEWEWQNISKLAFKEIYEDLMDFATKEKIAFASLACTVIVVVFTPKGLLVTHIGDGRAGYCNNQGEWKSSITPHKGEEANQTIFITSSPWLTNPEFKMSGVSVPESIVINEKVKAFTLMSDGCESHSFECSQMDGETNKWIDPNTPFAKFFNPLVAHLKVMDKTDIGIEEANSEWLNFLESGTPGLKEESDDKTLILGILV